jgi:cytochrome c oxidase subunit 2
VNTQPLITTTEAVDKVFYIIFGISGVALLGITVAMVYLVWRYNRKRYPVPLSQKDHNVWLEVTWTVIPSILVMLMFWYGWEGSWLFTYENGKTSDKLYVPVGQPVNVRLNSEDVLHSFYVPAFRVKRDCVPGMETYAWFVAEEPGSYDLFCAEYCGVAHADMITTVEAIPAAEFAGWLAEKPSATAAGQGLLQKHGCLGCHSLDGSMSVGPSFQGISGRQVTVVANGESRTLTCDRDYLETAILDPDAEIVEGFPAAMPPYAGKIPEEDLTGILDYLVSLKADGQFGEETTEDKTEVVETTEEKAPAEKTKAPAASEEPASPAERGEAVAAKNGCLGCHSVDGSKRVGPTLKGFWGSERIVTRDGQETTLVADDNYLIKASGSACLAGDIEVTCRAIQEP